MIVYDWAILQGATSRKTFVAVGKDLSGCTARLQARTAQQGDIIFELTTENGGIVLDGDQIRCTVQPADTDNATVKKGRWDLEIVIPEEHPTLAPGVERPLGGSVVLSPNYTQEAGQGVLS